MVYIVNTKVLKAKRATEANIMATAYFFTSSVVLPLLYVVYKPEEPLPAYTSESASVWIA